MKKLFLMLPAVLPAVAVIFILVGCVDCDGKSESGKTLTTSSRGAVSGKSVTILNWNVQTFFDAVKDGNEYSDFKKAKAWNLDSYVMRLERLCKVIKECDADIVVMEELEKKEQLADITNVLAGTFNFKSLYNYACFSKNDDSSIGTGILSRYQIEDFCVHNIDFRADRKKQPSMRPIGEVTIYLGGARLKLFVNHWKSKSSGADESEIWRDRQENVLAKNMKKTVENGTVAVACGDFNRELKEFSIKEGNIFLGKIDFPCKNPWIGDDGTIKSNGSYRYNGKWEKIDHFFVASPEGKAASIKRFEVKDSGEWASADGYPKRYEIWTGEGYSDHLPIFIELSL